MPFTPYHFGPSGFIGLSLRRYIDLPIFVLVNVAVDVEVLFANGWPVHRYSHTLLFGAILGAICGIAAYLARPLFIWAMKLVRIPYKPTLTKAILSGIGGVWLHNFIDAIYHPDVKLFWPSKVRPLWRLLSHEHIKLICVIFFIATVILYIFLLASNRKKDDSLL